MPTAIGAAGAHHFADKVARADDGAELELAGRHGGAQRSHEQGDGLHREAVRSDTEEARVLSAAAEGAEVCGPRSVCRGSEGGSGASEQREGRGERGN